MCKPQVGIQWPNWTHLSGFELVSNLVQSLLYLKYMPFSQHKLSHLAHGGRKQDMCQPHWDIQWTNWTYLNGFELVSNLAQILGHFYSRPESGFPSYKLSHLAHGDRKQDMCQPHRPIHWANWTYLSGCELVSKLAQSLVHYYNRPESGLPSHKLSHLAHGGRKQQDMCQPHWPIYLANWTYLCGYEFISNLAQSLVHFYNGPECGLPSHKLSHLAHDGRKMEMCQCQWGIHWSHFTNWVDMSWFQTWHKAWPIFIIGLNLVFSITHIITFGPCERKQDMCQPHWPI